MKNRKQQYIDFFSKHTNINEAILKLKQMRQNSLTLKKVKNENNTTNNN